MEDWSRRTTEVQTSRSKEIDPWMFQLKDSVEATPIYSPRCKEKVESGGKTATRG